MGEKKHRDIRSTLCNSEEGWSINVKGAGGVVTKRFILLLIKMKVFKPVGAITIDVKGR